MSERPKRRKGTLDYRELSKGNWVYKEDQQQNSSGSESSLWSSTPIYQNTFPFMIQMGKYFELSIEQLIEDEDLDAIMNALDSSGKLLDEKSVISTALSGYAAWKVLREAGMVDTNIEDFIQDFFVKRLPEALKKYLPAGENVVATKAKDKKTTIEEVENYIIRAYENPGTRSKELWMQALDLSRTDED